MHPFSDNAMIIVLLLCGPPGVGKSTLASRLREEINQKCNIGGSCSPHFENLEFDVVEADRGLWDEHSFRSSRKQGISELKRIITENAERDSCTIVIVDDIMYLHSMRRAVYVACRDMGVDHLLNVRVTSNLSTALIRNSFRTESRKVAEEVVRKIFTQFEELNASLSHEKRSFIVNCNSQESADKDILILVNEIDKMLHDDVKIMGKKSIHGVKNILEDVSNREGNHDSQMISIDLILRKAVSSFMRELSGLDAIKQNREMCRKISKIASDIKAEILDRARNCSVRHTELDPGTSSMESDPGTCSRHSLKSPGCNNENTDVSVERKLAVEPRTNLYGERAVGFHENQSTEGLNDIMENNNRVDQETFYVHQFKSTLRSHLVSFFASQGSQNLTSSSVLQITVDDALNHTNSADDRSLDAARIVILDLLSVE